jgi:uncharacterized membrane protein (DUF485 family)
MSKTVQEIIQSARFKRLVVKRWSVSFLLTFLLFVLYFGYILSVGYAKEWLAQKVFVYTNVGILFGALVIVGAWILTMVYVIWANSSYDKEVEFFKKELK